MKPYLLFLVIFIFSMPALYAQKMKYGVEAGPNISGAIVKDPGGSPSGSSMVGFQLGAFDMYALPNSKLSVEARLLFSAEGYSPTIYDTKSTIHVSFLKIPLNLVYVTGTGAGKWQFGLGPCFAFGLGGNYTNSGNKIPIDFGNNSNKDDLKKMDLAADLMAGYQLNDNIMIRGAFDFGLGNYLTPGSTQDASAHSLSMGVTVAYKLGGK